jgi:hypothetical protein
MRLAPPPALKLLLFSLIPRTRSGDHLVALLRFLRAHRRWPSDAVLFNDVLHRLKTSRTVLAPEKAFTSDKYLVKLYIRAVLRRDAGVPTLAVLDSPAAVDAFTFPPRCAIKPTHASGQIIIRTDGEQISNKEIKRWFEIDYYKSSREANYKFLTPRVIVEPLIFESSNIEDVKFFCVNGTVRLIQTDFDRRSRHTRRLYDRDWNDLDCSLGYPLSPKTRPRPANLDELIDAAERLAALFDFVRVDMYTDDETFFVGEITHCHGNAEEVFFPPEAEVAVSRLLFQTG